MPSQKSKQRGKRMVCEGGKEHGVRVTGNYVTAEGCEFFMLCNRAVPRMIRERTTLIHSGGPRGTMKK